jgi:hypothetical protein
MDVNRVHTISQLSMTSSCTCLLHLKAYTNDYTMVHKHLKYYQPLTDNIIILVWTPWLMHRCVISTMFGTCFSFFIFLFYLMCFLFLLLFCIIYIKCFFFTFVFLCIWMQVWGLEKEDTPHSFSSRVFLHHYKFYFFLFSTVYLVSSFLSFFFF